MKIVIVGYGEMFKALISGVLETQHEIAGVFRIENVKYPPLRRFVHDLFKPSDDYNFVKTHNLPQIRAKSVNSPEFVSELKKLNADIILVGSWSEKFSMQTINTAKKACINVHPSLLPRYRGPNPYFQAIKNNEEKTGVTFHLMDVNYDTGLILHQAEVPILPHDTGMSLKLRCCDAAKNEVIVLLNEFSKKIKNPISQSEKEATYQMQISLADSILDFEKETALETDRRIRGLNPWLNCHICCKNEFFSFSNHKICQKTSKKPPATIVKITDNSMYIVCKDGGVIEFSSLRIKRPFSKMLTKFCLNRVIKVNDKAV